MKLQGFVEVEGNDEQSEVMLKKLNEMAEYGELRKCRRKYLLNYFGETAPDNCGSCDVCLSEFEMIDGTIIAQKAMSAVSRLNQSFGAGYIIDFLRGSKSEKIRPNHKELKTYGVGKDISKEEWNRYIYDLIHLGYLEKKEGRYPVLQLTERSQAVLRGEEKVEFRKVLARKEADKPLTTVPLEESLLNELKKLRMRLAENENVPAYIIFSDNTLHELASYLPQSLEEIEHISGFGTVKLKKYGAAFVESVKSYCLQHDLKSRMDNKGRRKKKRNTHSKISNTQKESLELFKDGATIDEIAAKRGITNNTVQNHLNAFVRQGTLEPTKLMTQELYDEIAAAFEGSDLLSLRPIKEKLREEITYEQIRTVQNHLLFLQTINGH